MLSQTAPLSVRTGLVTRVVEDLSLIHHSISFINILSDSFFPSDDISEHLSITATINNAPVNIHNINICPIFSCPTDFSPNFHHIFNFRDNNIIMGDFSAHSPAW